MCSELKNVIIPENVTSIGNSAFYLCANLTGITIPSSVTSIEDNAFTYCPKLKNVIYTGTKADWNGIKIGSGNEYLKAAEIQFK